MRPFSIQVDEPHIISAYSKLGWLRASVLGANDGIVSIAALIVGVAGATNSVRDILTAGFAGLLAGALSMAAGEYVSVSTQRDTEQALLAKERYELEHEQAKELEELTRLYEDKGLSRATAEIVAKELTSKKVFEAHAEAELHIDPHNLANPWRAVGASAMSFVVGASIPLSAIVFAPSSFRIVVTFLSVAVALFITGALSAKVGGAGKKRAALRVAGGGLLAMGITYLIGIIFGVSGI